MSLEYILTSFVVILLPGTGVLYTVAVGLGKGFRPSIAAAFGCTLGIVPAALASIIGVAAVFHTSALAFQILKYLGVAYLFYMSWSILRSGNALGVSGEERERSLYRTVLDGVLLNVLNPKLSMFFLAFLPQFVSPNSENATYALLLHAFVFMGLTLLVFICYGVTASLTRDYVINRPKVMAWLKRGFAATFGALGVKLALFES
ncbi:Homoserine/homoserine lactone efflux protein [Pseudovibrio axinellae]|uniref:Homoserine/homoserine lactone efflux protein n=1 Tax=Pseudovibrio axinellae TaxID=989403 RepID=A0A165Z977_9HYPH|nr:LysE family translocator [Pseudovibrio axinellae]KZL19623.1 Homoserine/homoserine lactone efflux protein [Pseudovibrio axinellae]SEQ34583.1 Threonine/homoserine/homoserine lactone efflux protein [Pseudovibrio axinellae]